MNADDLLLVELMLQADLFCNQTEAAAKKKLPAAEMKELRLKISQCRGALAELQEKYENDQLSIANTAVCADFRNLLISLQWAGFLARGSLDRRLFRKLVQIESGFTYLLITRRRGKT